MLKFHLHNGTRLERVFYAHDTLQTVRDFIDVEFFDRDIPITNYELATNFPKKVYGPELIDVTLADVVGSALLPSASTLWCPLTLCSSSRVQGLAPQSLVFVQDLDS